MILIELTNIPDAALPVDALKAHLRMGTSFGIEDVQDAVLTSFLRAAMAAVEGRTGKALLIRDFALSGARWDDGGSQILPIAPVTEVTRVAVVDRAGHETEIAESSWWLERDAHVPRLTASGHLPNAPTGGEVRAEFTAGYGASWPDIPSDLQQAVMLLAAHYYEYRDDTSLSGGCMPFGVSSLIERFRVLRLGSVGTGR